MNYQNIKTTKISQLEKSQSTISNTSNSVYKHIIIKAINVPVLVFYPLCIMKQT